MAALQDNHLLWAWYDVFRGTDAVVVSFGHFGLLHRHPNQCIRDACLELAFPSASRRSWDVGCTLVVGGCGLTGTDPGRKMGQSSGGAPPKNYQNYPQLPPTDETHLWSIPRP